MAKLTVLKVDAMKTPGRYCDGGGLYLQVRGPETKSWLFRYMMKGHARSMGLGPYPVRTLAMARMDALEARRLIFQGLDPIEAKAATTVARKVEEGSGRTFRDVAAGHIEAQRGGWKNPKSAAQWTASLEAHVFPKLGGMAVSKIATDDVLGVLKPIWSTVPETAGRVRQRIEAIMDAAVAMKLRAPGPNPAAWQSNLQPLLPPLARMKKAAGQASHPALPWAQMPSFMKALHLDGGTAARALELAILTACRSGEVRGAVWSEIDLEAATWIIPASKMKATVMHRVPLSPAAVALLRSIPRTSNDPVSLVFPGTTRKGGKQAPLSDATLGKVIKRMNTRAGGPRWLDQLGQPIVPHGFRSTFRVWLSEATNCPHEVAEAALAHTVKNKSEAAYSRSDHLERRREFMTAWSAFIGGARS